MDRRDRLAGVLLGTAVGDALGLPREGLSRRRAGRMFGAGPLAHRFVLGRGMVSDDTEHTCMAAQALLRAPHDPEGFARSLAWRLRLWLLGLPAGIGLGTGRAILKLWLGFPPGRSGVWSAGNGPAMRAAVLGACAGADPPLLEALVRASTLLTHRDPRALAGALAIALSAGHAARHEPAAIDPDAVLHLIRERAGHPELLAALDTVAAHLRRGAAAHELAEALGQGAGISGYVFHTVPAALYCWLRHPTDFRQAVEAVIGLGGDSDTTGAIVGGLSGAAVGAAAIPTPWRTGLVEWPRTPAWMERLAERLARQYPGDGEGQRSGPLPLFWPGLLPRNLFFLTLVLLHGLRRLLPPY